MATLNKNILANLAGGLWIAALTVIITPLQVRLLGIEAYGLVGLITVLQIILGAFDLGLSATITQRIAADKSPGLSASAGLINSASTIYWCLAALMGCTLWAAAPLISDHLFNTTTLPAETVHLALQAIAFYLALRWPIAFYSGLISGLQRMDVLNILKSGAISLRLLGGVAVLLWQANLIAFLAWFALSAALELIAYVVAATLLLPGFRWRPAISFQAVREVWKFSAAMSLIAALSILLTQVDRLIISKLLGLEALGYYSLAYNTALALSLLQTAFNSAALPAFSAAHGQNDQQELLNRYEKTSQLMGYVIALPCCALIFFGHDILALWITPASADGAALPMALLALGFFFNAMVSNAYVMAVARGKPQLPLRINLVGALIYLPLLYIAVWWGGPRGAAVAWIILNLYYLLTLYPAVQRGLLGQKLLPWLRRNLFSFLLLGLASFGSLKFLATLGTDPALRWGALGTAMVVYAGIGFVLLTPALRGEMLGWGKRLFPSVP